jgi:hypothetical protein
MRFEKEIIQRAVTILADKANRRVLRIAYGCPEISRRSREERVKRAA